MTKRDEIVYELNQLAEQHGGKVQPQQVVEFAKDESTALHNAFEWDDSEAAEKYRLHQARHLLRVHVRMVLPNGKPENVRAFVSLSDDRKSREGYRPLVNVLGDEQMRRALVIDAISELRAFERKYKHLDELANIFAAVREVEKEVAQEAQQVAQQA